MKILVTGGAGFLGSHLTDRLVELGHDVIIVDNLSTGSRHNINKKSTFLLQDITNRRSVRDFPATDIVFHTAALARIQPSIKNPAPAHDANVTGTLNILEYCRRHGAKLIFSSSSSVLSGEDLPASEESETHPRNPYSLQKLMCEQYIDLYRELYGLKAATLRYFNVYGERMLLEGGYTTALGVFLKQHADGKPLTITGDGEQRRDFTYVGDVVDANILAIEWEGLFNIGRGKNYSVNEIADIVGGEKLYIPARLGEVRQTLCNNQKAKKHGWEPKTEVEAWLNSYLNLDSES